MKAHTVRYSKLAVQDLERVWNEVFEASQNDEITRNYIDALMDKIETKAEFPKSGAPLYYEDAFTGYYYVAFKKYIGFYRVESETIFVDRVLFAASDYLRILHID